MAELLSFDHVPAIQSAGTTAGFSKQSPYLCRCNAQDPTYLRLIMVGLSTILIRSGLCCLQLGTCSTQSTAPSRRRLSTMAWRNPSGHHINLWVHRWVPDGSGANPPWNPTKPCPDSGSEQFSDAGFLSVSCWREGMNPHCKNPLQGNIFLPTNQTMGLDHR